MFDLDRLSSIRIGLASPETIRGWSYAERHGAKPGAGEVLKAETINYRSQKPEPEGLFCERIFGPAKDYECHCGKYKKIRFAGITCEKCGVEITAKAVRRERMGYINLATPCSHIWYLKGTPSKMALLLDIAPKELEEVIYFQSHVILVTGSCKLLSYKEVLDEKNGREKFIQILNGFLDEGLVTDNQPEDKRRCLELIEHLHNNQETYDFISTSRFITKFTGAQFGWGAEAVKTLLQKVDIEAEFANVENELKETQSQKNQKRQKLLKRLEVIEALRGSGNNPAWMILETIPVIPPDLRPMTQLDGGRYAVSDLNELYRRVIIRNARLKKLIDMKSPTVIMVNEKRMLQESIDALIDNGRRNKPVTGTQGRPLKSLSSALKGKAGRFRQNLLGKRVDYSGRSVICVGPFLRMNQCGLPSEMAIQLFKPFIASALMAERYASTTKQADQMIARYDDKVYDVLERIVPNHPVLLNRAPTLHRLGIEAFRPVLVDGSAIRLHPLVCPGFNADFDGDQMAIHVPLSREAQQEALDLMISTKNILSPRDATVLSIPVQDIVVGHFFLTSEQTSAEFGEQEAQATKFGDAIAAARFHTYALADGQAFSDFDEVMKAYDNHLVHINNRIVIPAKALNKTSFTPEQNNQYLLTSVGKLIFNSLFPEDFPYVNDSPSHAKGLFDGALNEWFVPFGTDFKEHFKTKWQSTAPVSKPELSSIINELFRRYHAQRTAILLDRIKNAGYQYCTKLGLTISVTDIDTLPGREKVIAEADKDVEKIQSDYDDGLLTPEQRHDAIIGRWKKAKDDITAMVGTYMAENPHNPVFMMARSGARGSTNNFVQLIGMRGLMSGPNGKTLEIPVKDSFRDGMDVSEYFIATHGARKGSTDTALKTADSGYLTRRLVDVSHSVVIREEDCGADYGFVARPVYDNEGKEIVSVVQRCLGRFSAHDILDQKGNLLAKADEFIDEEIANKIAVAGLEAVEIRSLLTCQAKEGVCVHCYGRNMATGEMAKLGDTVGIMAAQSIGEPGTQLTMRTFHEGGTAGSDITQGLPRVQELLEVRNPKGQATISAIQGEVSKIEQVSDRWAITVKNDLEEKKYITNYGAKVKVAANEHVLNGQPLTYGSIDPKELLEVTDVATVSKYLIDEVQKVYCAQGINVSDKHIEVIVRQMLGKVVVVDGGDTLLISGMRTDLLTFTGSNQKALENNQRPAVGRPLLLGVTKAALDTYSFLSAASFQEVTRVLTDATLQGKTDYLKGLKENVMIGKLIPAGTGIEPLNPDEDFVANAQESQADFERLTSGFTDNEFYPEKITSYNYVEPAKAPLPLPEASAEMPASPVGNE